MSAKAALGPSIVTASALALLAVASGWWRTTVTRANRPSSDVKPQPWEHVKEDYPPPADVPVASTPVELAQEVIQANPFSPKRRITPPATTEPGGPEPDAPAAPKFIYKGHLNLGARRRAIVEDTTVPKTYFLEVGQEVAGFKVLDITETQVVLSDLQTHEEVVVSLSAKKSP